MEVRASTLNQNQLVALKKFRPKNSNIIMTTTITITTITVMESPLKSET